MSLDMRTFETLVPSRFITFTFPNPIADYHQLHTTLLRIAVLDSITPANPLHVAAIIVPIHRETDWIFSTEAGHLQLLVCSPQISRLILIGNIPNTSHPASSYTKPMTIDSSGKMKLEENLTPLLIALSPKSTFVKGFPEIPFLTYEDDVLSSVIVERCVGSFVGEMLIEDVELKCQSDECTRERRRRLRFKRMPNLVQTQMRLRKNGGFGGVKFDVDARVLVQPYLTPMVASLSLIASRLDERIQRGFTPKALCLGVGGGALLTFLNQLGFQVVGVEADQVVLRVARQHFGLEERNAIQVSVGDAVEFIESYALNKKKRVDDVANKFDVVMVDLDSRDVGFGLVAPPLEFAKKSVLQCCKLALGEHGIVVINVISHCRTVYESLISDLKGVYQDLYGIDVGNGENYVVIASASPIRGACSGPNNTLLTKLNLGICRAWVDSIKKL